MDNFTKAVLTEADKQINKGNGEWVLRAIDELADMTKELWRATSDTDAVIIQRETIRNEHIMKRLIDKLR